MCQQLNKRNRVFTFVTFRHHRDLAGQQHDEFASSGIVPRLAKGSHSALEFCDVEDNEALTVGRLAIRPDEEVNVYFAADDVSFTVTLHSAELALC